MAENTICLPLVLKTGMHCLMCILVYAAQLNAVLVARNDAELGSNGEHSAFKKQFFIAICLDCATSAPPQILKQSILRSQKTAFINKYVYLKYIYIFDCICLNNI